MAVSSQNWLRKSAEIGRCSVNIRSYTWWQNSDCSSTLGPEFFGYALDRVSAMCISFKTTHYYTSLNVKVFSVNVLVHYEQVSLRSTLKTCGLFQHRLFSHLCTDQTSHTPLQ